VAEITQYGPIVVIPDTTRCKHGTSDCKKCGTSNRRDVTHSTEGGRGKIARLRKNRKP
jgi:hypothetical protein